MADSAIRFTSGTRTQTRQQTTSTRTARSKKRNTDEFYLLTNCISAQEVSLIPNLNNVTKALHVPENSEMFEKEIKNQQKLNLIHFYSLIKVNI